MWPRHAIREIAARRSHVARLALGDLYSPWQARQRSNSTIARLKIPGSWQPAQHTVAPAYAQKQLRALMTAADCTPRIPSTERRRARHTHEREHLSSAALTSHGSSCDSMWMPSMATGCATCASTTHAAVRANGKVPSGSRPRHHTGGVAEAFQLPASLLWLQLARSDQTAAQGSSGHLGSTAASLPRTSRQWISSTSAGPPRLQPLEGAGQVAGCAAASARVRPVLPASHAAQSDAAVCLPSPDASSELQSGQIAECRK